MGNLPLQKYIKTGVKYHDDFYGKIIEQMPRLIAQGRTPLSVAELMRQRILALSQPEDIKNAWWNNYFHLGDAVLYHPNSNIKTELDSQLLRQLNPQSKLQNGLWLITDEIYNASEGKEFSRDELSPLDTSLDKTAILSNPLWKYLAREDKGLLEEYTEAVFKEAQTFNYDSNMGIYLSTASGQTPLAGAWCVGRTYYRSRLNGNDNLGGEFGSLVGYSRNTPKSY
ncbi:MAG: hypothetical protein AABX47_00205 [Nanoarchaeota archaeon]